MRRITPTGWGKQKGTPVEQLGTLEAVVRAMAAVEGVLSDGGVIIIPRLIARTDVERVIRDAGFDPYYFALVSASGGPGSLYNIRPETVVGVAPDAFEGIPGEMWADMQRIMSSRFRTVFWG